MFHRYEKLDENYKMHYCPANDNDGSVTGKIVMNVKAWFDENPEEARKRGWIKHLSYESNEEFKKDFPDFDPASQILVSGTKRIDDFTIQDEYHIIDKTPEMMELEEMLESMGLYTPAGYVQLDAQGGILV